MMASFTSTMEGLEKIKSLLDEPFVEPLKQAAEVMSQLAKATAACDCFLCDLKEKGTKEMTKKETIPELAEQFWELTDKVCDPSKTIQVAQLQATGGRFPPIQEMLINFLKILLLSVNEKLTAYRVVKPNAAPTTAKSTPLTRGPSVAGVRRMTSSPAGGVVTDRRVTVPLGRGKSVKVEIPAKKPKAHKDTKKEEGKK